MELTEYLINLDRENRKKYNEWLKMIEKKVQKNIENMNKLNEMIENQNNLCAICSKPESRKGRTVGSLTPLCIDHDHFTGKIRGLLCHTCNTAIGKFNHDIELLEKAILYIKYHS